MSLNKHLFKHLLFVFASATMFSSVAFLSHDTYAYSLSVTADSTTLNVVSGKTSIKESEIEIISDCRAGYNFSLSTSNSPSLYLNGDDSGSAVFNAVDGTSSLSSSSNSNKWGYYYNVNSHGTTNAPTESSIFTPLSTTPTVLKTTTDTASPSSDIDDTFSIYYGVNTADSVVSGSYAMSDGNNSNNTNGTINYYATMDSSCIGYIVNFNPNGGTGTMTSQSIPTGTSTKLKANEFTAPSIGSSYQDADGTTVPGTANKLWTFWGWNTSADGTGDWYKDRESVTDLEQSGNSITLYAQWKQPTLADLTTSTPSGSEKTIDHNTMQDMSPAACYNSDITTTENAPAATLVDYRGKVTTGNSPESPESYNVSKLADGNCWMTTNLNLGRDSGGPNGDGTITLDSDDTDLADDATFTLPVSTTTSSTTTTAARIRVTNTSGNNNNGTYYSWPAAIASTATYTTTNVIVTSSVCPKNWDLPTNDQYTNLQIKAAYTSSNTTTSAPSSFLTNGGFTNGATFYQTSYSHFWTSRTAGTYAYGSRVNASSISVSSSSGTTYGGNKYYEKNIRCVASNGTVTINYEGNGTTAYPVIGTTASQINAEINSTNTMANGFTRTNWAFNGWNTAADGSGTSIAASTVIASLNPTPGSTITLYAQWIPQYTITYVNNCQTYASANSACTNAVSSTTDSSQKINLANNPSTGTETGTLAYNKWTLTGWKIKGWSTVADNSDNTNTEYGAGTTYTVPAGSGVGDSITLYAHWVPIYTVQYDGNGSDNDSTGMGSTDATTGIKTVAHTNVAEGDTFDLFASNFKRAGYGFVGWSTDQDAWSKLTDNDTTNDAKIWGPNEIITAPAYNGTPITTLYAIWAPAETSGGNPVYLQGWTGCSAMTATTYNSTTGTLTVAKNSITALTDQRDNEVYTIAKLADENCWMVENLRLDDSSELSTSNTNIDSTNSTLPITNIYNADSSLATTSNYLSATSSSWCTTSSIACNNQSLLNTTNTTANITPSQTQSITSANAHTSFSNTIYSYGNYYNWYSATAGYGTYGRTTSEPTAGDLCPAGWKLPYGGTGTSGTTNIGGTKGGFSYLDKQMGGTGAYQSTSAASNKWRMFPNNFVYSGYWTGSSAGVRGYYGYYWSASAIDFTYKAYILNFYITNVYPGSSEGTKRNGFTVRCVISPPKITDLTYLQDFSTLSSEEKTSVLDSMTTDQQYQLKDSRDGKVYYISKLQDGHVWMTQNLDLDLGVNTLTHNSTTLYHDDTDLGWGSDTATTSWTPANSTQRVTYDANMKGTFSSIGNTTADNSVPKSLDVGDWYYAGYDGTTLLASTTVNYLTSDNRTNTNGTVTVNNGSGVDYFSTAPFTTNGTHGHVGNYYNWSAAVASNDTSSYTASTVSNPANNPQNSICPAGWRLPVFTGYSATSIGTNEFANLNYYYNNKATNTSSGLEASPLFFARGGYVNGALLVYPGYYGNYWSSTVGGSSISYPLFFFATSIDSVTQSNRIGSSVRCLAR